MGLNSAKAASEHTLQSRSVEIGLREWPAPSTENAMVTGADASRSRSGTACSVGGCLAQMGAVHLLPDNEAIDAGHHVQAMRTALVHAI
jgi:hypothetical protein